MANAKQLACIILLMLLFAKFESRSLEAFMERKKTPIKGCSPELIQKSQMLKTSFAKKGRFTNPTYFSERLSPGGPDHKHH
uniref:Uncharacterized protein n=1 Tax=Cajanus cajan TaxID=3821 RepID=A0A151SEW0_CAJCA|nr:hypothetical protein KK1_024684 [Cajanus cajan]